MRAALDIPATLPSTRKLQEAYASCLAPVASGRNGGAAAARDDDDDDDDDSDSSDGRDGAPEAREGDPAALVAAEAPVVSS